MSAPGTDPLDFDAAMALCPLVAILRGIRPREAEPIAGCLVEAGFRAIEVPLNSPEPLVSIERIARAVEGSALVGAGTVLAIEEVEPVASAGGRLVVAPNFDPAVVAAARRLDLDTLPGVATPTEAFAAWKAGATALKLFPGELVTPAVLGALRAVLPPACRLFPVGGISPGSIAPYLAKGAAGFGIGSALYRPGKATADVAREARAFVAAWRAAPPPGARTGSDGP